MTGADQSPQAPQSASSASPLSVLRTGVRRALRRPWLVVSLWLLSLSISFTATLPVLSGLHGALDNRPLARALSQGQAPALWVELAADNPALSRVLVPGLLLSGMLFWLLSSALCGGFLQALRRPGDPRRALGAKVLLEAARHAGAMLSLSLHGLLLRLPVVGVAVLLATVLARWGEGKAYLQVLGAGSVALLGCLFLWSAVSVTLHYAQVYRLGSPHRARRASLGAIRQGLRHATRQGGLFQTALLACFSLGSIGVLVIFGLLAGQRLDAALLVGTGLCLRQVLGLGRAFVALSVVAASVESIDAHPERPFSPGKC